MSGVNRAQQGRDDTSGHRPADGAQSALAVRLLIAFAQGSQKELGRLARVNPARISEYATGKGVPTLRMLERLSEAVGLTLSAVEALVFDGLRAQRAETLPAANSVGGDTRHRGRDLQARLLSRLQSLRYERSSRVHPPEGSPEQENERAIELFNRLERLQPLEREAVVAVAPEFQTWALVVLLADESWERAQAEPQESLGLARLAVLVARRIGGSAGWRSRVQGFAEAHVAHALRLNGDLANAEASFAHAKRCFAMGRASDPGGLLSPSRVLLLEAELRRLKGRARISNATSISGCGAVNSR